VALLLVLSPSQAREPASRNSFNVVEASIPDMQAALARRRVTSRELVQQYLARIATYEDKFHAALTVIRMRSKRPTRSTGSAGPGEFGVRCTGIPVAIKDNIHTTDMADDRRGARLRPFGAAL
jgi:amidase